MREQTALPHHYIYVGRLYDAVKKTGNFDRDRKPINLILIHSMAGSLQGSTAHFQNPATIPSAHYGIGLNGAIVQWLPENAVAYHAGKYSVNQNSIGIEHEDNGNNQIVRTDALYESSARLVADIALHYGFPIDREHVKLHREIVATQCPGSLDVDRIIRRAQELAHQVQNKQQVGVDPDVFRNIVTKSTEYDEVWKALKLPEELKGNAGSHKLVVDDINRRITEALARNAEPAVTTPAPEVPAVPEVPAGPTEQSIPLYKKDILDILTAVFRRRKKKEVTK